MSTRRYRGQRPRSDDEPTLQVPPEEPTISAVVSSGANPAAQAEPPAPPLPDHTVKIEAQAALQAAGRDANGKPFELVEEELPVSSPSPKKKRARPGAYVPSPVAAPPESDPDLSFLPGRNDAQRKKLQKIVIGVVAGCAVILVAALAVRALSAKEEAAPKTTTTTQSTKPTATATETATATATPIATATTTPTASATATATASASASASATTTTTTAAATATPTVTATATATPTPTATTTPVATATATHAPAPTQTVAPHPAPTPSPRPGSTRSGIVRETPF